MPGAAGLYRADVVVAGPDGAEVGRRQSGWTSDPAAAEFRALRPNRELLEKLAEQTGGRVIPRGGPGRLRRRAAQLESADHRGVDYAAVAPVVGLPVGDRLPMW